MKKTSFAALLCLFGLVGTAHAEGPAAAPGAIAAPAAIGAPGAIGIPGAPGAPGTGMPGAMGMPGASGTPAMTPPPGSGAGAILKALQGQSPATVPIATQPVSPAEAGSQQQGEGKTTTAPLAAAAGKAQPVEASAVEKAMSEESLTAEKSQPQAFTVGSISQFGYNFFRPDAGAFAPLTDVPVGPDYIIGVGDRIVLTVWGSIDGSYELEVNRNGEIALPKVGTVKVAGVSYGQLPEVIRVHLAKAFKNPQLNVNIGRLRLIKVYLVGQVNAPGDYNINSMSTLINALSAAGGPTKNGSLRTVQIKRNGRTVETVDLYDFFLKGDKSKDIRLQPGDAVFVPTIGPVAGIAGNVRRPAIYELKDEKTLKDLLALADGINPGGYLQRLQISRTVAHEKKIVADVNLDPARDGKKGDEQLVAIPIQDMDLVKVFPIDPTLRGYIRLDGYVLRPGNYALKPGMRIRDILLQDNLLPEYYLETGEITRLYPPDYHPQKLIFNPAKALAGDPAYNLELNEFDVVRIFSRWEMEEKPKARIYGEVQRPGDYQLFQNLTVRDLVIMAGNPKLTAYMKNAEITRIKKTGESVTLYTLSIDLEEALKGNPQHNIALLPFDEVYIRKIPNWRDEVDRYVTLKGEFMFPGVYGVAKGEKLSNVILRAGGFTEDAYPKAAKFTRVAVRELQQKRQNEALAKAEQEIMQKQAELAAAAASKEELEANKLALDSLKRTVDQLKTVKAEGRLVIRLDQLDKFRNSTSDIELQGGDELIVPPTPDSINIIGQVYNPTSLIPSPNEDVAFYLAKAGGPTKEAEDDDIYVVKPDGTVVSRQQTSWFKNLFNAGFMSTKLEPGDTIVVPQRFEKTAWMRDIKDIATILGQVALAGGVLIAAGL